MIVVLTAEPGKRSFWARFRKQASFQECKVLGESVMLVYPGEEPNWDKLAQKLGRYASRVLVSPGNQREKAGIRLPKQRPWHTLDNSKIKEQILCNTLCHLSEQYDWVGLYDPEGKLGLLVWELVQHFPRVTVWCRHRERYQALCHDLMEQFGAVIELTAAQNGLEGCPLLAAMEPPAFGIHWDGLLLLCGKTEIPHFRGRLQQELKVPLPEEAFFTLPPDVDRQELYLAIRQEQRRRQGTGTAAQRENLCFLLESEGEEPRIEKFL